MIFWWKTSLGDSEIQKVRESILNENISQGPVTDEFEASLAKALDVPYVVATTSGSVALLMALMALGVKRDDEVIIPNRTWIATAHAPLMLGAKVVLVDVLPNQPIMDVTQIKRKITKRTKAIIPVHLNGRSVDMDYVRKLAMEYGLHVIEDAAQALFSKNSEGYLGTYSDAGCFSLSVAKLITTGQGGFIVTRNSSTYEKLRLIRTHGVRDVIHTSFSELGFNFRFTDILASVGIEQLALVHKRIAHLKAIYSRYESGLKYLPFLKSIPVDLSQGELPLYIEVLHEKRDSLEKFLALNGIQIRPFYPDLDSAPHLACNDEFPNSRPFGKNGLFLPSGPDQSLENVDRVIDCLNAFGEI